VENSVAGWLLKQDYRDYYDNKGVSAGLGLHLQATAIKVGNMVPQPAPAGRLVQ
jgi:hypothetical protein